LKVLGIEHTREYTLFLFFPPRKRLRSTMPFTRTGIPLRSIPAGEGPVGQQIEGKKQRVKMYRVDIKKTN
jgi:hypothetical protein